MRLGGSGISAKIHLESTGTDDKDRMFRVVTVKVKVDSLKFAIRESSEFLSSPAMREHLK